MIEKLPRYESLLEKRSSLFETTHKLKEKLKGEKDNLRLHIEYDKFKGRLDEVRKDLRAYQKIKKYANSGNYKKVCEMTSENYELERVLSKENLLELADYLINNLEKNLKKLDNEKK